MRASCGHEISIDDQHQIVYEENGDIVSSVVCYKCMIWFIAEMDAEELIWEYDEDNNIS